MLAYDDPLPLRPQRVVVAGVSGSGKTTLAGRIAAMIDAPHTEIDGLYHGADWMPRPEFLDEVRALVANEAWTTEWQYADARPILSERADLLVWLDVRFATVTLPRVIRRTLHRRLTREQLWNGNIEPPLHTFFTDREHIVRWAVATRHKYRERMPRLEAQHPELPIVRLRSPRETEAWLSGPLAESARAGAERRTLGDPPRASGGENRRMSRRKNGMPRTVAQSDDAPHVPSPGEPSVPQIEVDETIPPRPEEEIADVLRAEPDTGERPASE
ncbi:AAA family ATPase [uncultured Microbacterium sp.]|uniref:AAA family ATPase n=1 Tax=uncultured Microbacterium sp. TaxID=191216 RepID=UPI0028D27B4E|nr:AAA family ATPase [uncultured Microbacterium sp.]